MILSCGCEQDGSARCDYHREFLCHHPTLKIRAPEGIEAVLDCPPCRIAKWRSVYLSPAATPTRNQNA